MDRSRKVSTAPRSVPSSARSTALLTLMGTERPAGEDAGRTVDDLLLGLQGLADGAGMLAQVRVEDLGAALAEGTLRGHAR